MAADDDKDRGGADPRRLWDEARRAIAGASPQRGALPGARWRATSIPRATRARSRRCAACRMPIGPAARLVAPGDWLSTELLGVPILVVRGDDGALRAFINVCRHRGALVAPPQGSGDGKARFVCPYHSWTYDACGALVGRPHEGDFPHVPRAAAALVRAAGRRALRPGLGRCPKRSTRFDWNGYFGPLADELEQLGHDSSAASPHERRFAQPSNWKLVLDANLESYHFQYAHRATIAHLFHDNLVQQASYGRHQRIVLPKRSLAEAAGDEAGWARLGRHSNIIYFFFPATFLLWEGDHANVFNVTPAAAASCATASWMIVPAAMGTARAAAEHWERNWKIFWDAIDEDFALAASMQSGLASGANAALNFGANEFACELFERAVEELIGGP